MAKSIRKVSSQPKAPALHSILLSQTRQDVDIFQYFNVKRDQGPTVVPPPILNGAVVSELQRVLKERTERKVAVQIVIVCLDEFSSNNQVQEPWSVFHEEISHLLFGCLSFIADARKHDSVHKTTTFQEALKITNKLCHVLICLSGKSVNLSTSIFNKCAKWLLSLLLARDVTKSLQELILTALSALCREADQQHISATLKQIALHLKYVAKMVLDMPVNTQTSIYTILSKSVLSKEDAAEKAHIWFSKWPTLKDAFIESCTKGYSEGCGLFLDKLFEVRTNSNMNHKSIRTPHSNVQSLNSICPSQKIARNIGATSIAADRSCQKSGAGSKQSSALKPPSDRDQFHTPTVQKTKHTEREASQQFHSSNLKKLTKSQHSKIADREKFNISPKNRQFCPRRDSDISASNHDPPEILKKNTSSAQSPLSVLGEEDHCSKVERWFSGFLGDSHNHAKKSAKLSDDASQSHGEVRVTGQKRSSPTSPSAQSKKRRLEVPPTPISKGQPSKHPPKGEARGAIQYEMPSIKLKKTISVEPENKATSFVPINSTPGQRTGKRTLYSKSHSKEYLDENFSLEDNQTLEPRQEQNSKTNNRPPKHWEQKVKELDNTSQLKKSQIYNFEKTESEKSFKIPSKAPPRKKTAKAKIPPRFSCFVNNSYFKNKENIPTKAKSNQDASKTIYHSSLKPVVETTNLKTPLKDITNRQCNSTNISLNKNTNSKNNGSIASSTPQVGSEKISLKTPLKVTNPVLNRQCSSTTISMNKNTNSKNNGSTASSTPQVGSEKINLKTPLKVTNPVLNRQCSSTIISMNKNTNSKNNGSTASSTCQVGSGSEDTQNSTHQYYSPILDDSFEIKQLKTEVHQEQTIQPLNHSNNVKTETKKTISPPAQQPNCTKPLSPSAQQGEHMTIWSEHSGAMKKTRETVGLEKNSVTKEIPNGSVSSAKGSKETPSTSRKHKSREWDSGIDTSDVLSSSSKEAKSNAVRKESANSQYLRMRLKDYLERAKDANSEMSAHQNVVSAEMAEIKSLVEKLTASVDRCQTASNSTETKLREQTKSLTGCSRYLGPYEDQTFPAKVSARKAMDYKEFARQIRARSAQRMRELLQTVIDEDLPLSPPLSDVDE